MIAKLSIYFPQPLSLFSSSLSSFFPTSYLLNYHKFILVFLSPSLPYSLPSSLPSYLPSSLTSFYHSSSPVIQLHWWPVGSLVGWYILFPPFLLILCGSGGSSLDESCSLFRDATSTPAALPSSCTVAAAATRKEAVDSVRLKCQKRQQALCASLAPSPPLSVTFSLLPLLDFP